MTIETKPTNTPRVSVLMTIYNAEPFLRESIDSLISQTFPDWELIAIENGSSDASPSILAAYSDPRIRIFSLPENIGRTPALRYSFDQARGDYIAVLDADDVSHPERLTRQVAFLDRHPDVALVGSWAQFIDEHGNIFAEYKPPINQAELQDCLGWTDPIVHSSAMYRRQLALEVGGYPEELAYSQDFGLILALAQYSKIAMIDEFICQVRSVLTPTRLTASKKYQAIIARERLILFQRAVNMLPLSRKALRLNRRTIAIAELKLGGAVLSAGSVLAGVRLVFHGLARDPSALWTNGLAIRFLGRKLSFMENTGSDSYVSQT